jgi:uncharacterized protein
MPSSATAPAEAQARLRGILAAWPGAVVAYSGGVDSAVLLTAALEVLGRDRVLAVIADSPSLPRRELEEARAQAAALGAPLEILSTQELNDPRYQANAGDRCFWCKEALFLAAEPLARARGFVLCYGENADDLNEERPGARSAAARGVRAPLREAGWHKSDVRAFARARGLQVAEKVSSPCLASRLPVGVPVSRAALTQVERMEDAVRARGFQVLRARHMAADTVVLELDAAELPRATALEALLRADASLAGYASFSLRAYRRGAVAGAGTLEV